MTEGKGVSGEPMGSAQQCPSWGHLPASLALQRFSSCAVSRPGPADPACDLSCVLAVLEHHPCLEGRGAWGSRARSGTELWGQKVWLGRNTERVSVPFAVWPDCNNHFAALQAC